MNVLENDTIAGLVKTCTKCIRVNVTKSYTTAVLVNASTDAVLFFRN